MKKNKNNNNNLFEPANKKKQTNIRLIYFIKKEKKEKESFLKYINTLDFRLRLMYQKKKKIFLQLNYYKKKLLKNYHTFNIISNKFFKKCHLN